MRSGAEGEARDLDAGFAERDPVGGLGALRRAGQGSGGGEGAGGEAGFQKVAAGVASHGCHLRLGK